MIQVLRASTVRQWLVWFLCFFLLGALWAVALPRFSGPDEPAHVRKAVGTVRLQGIGTAIPGQPPWLRDFEVPDAYAAPEPGCFAFDAYVSAACSTLPPLTGDELGAASAAARYPPLYYAVTGAPSLLLTSYGGQYALRLASAALSAAGLATAFLLAGRSTRGPWLRVGALVTVTPMLVYLTGVVNPNGAESVWFLAGWVALLVAIEEHQAGRVPRWVTAGVLFSIGVLMRQLGAVWLAAGAAVVAVLLGWAGLRTALRDRGLRIAAAIVVGALALQFVWLAAVDSLGAIHDERVAVGDDTSTGTIVKDVFEASYRNVREMIGRLGWLDIPLPSLAELLWTVGLGGLVVAALVTAVRREAWALATAAAFTWAIPVFFEIKDARSSGHYWQGRYTLPIAVLVPILAAWALGGRWRGTMPSRLKALVATGLVVGHVLVFHQVLRRYMFGLAGPATLRDPLWQPPVSAWALIVAYGAVWAVVCWLVLGSQQPAASPRGDDAASGR